MDILKLKIQNFCAIGDAPELSLQDKGLVLIQGVNEDDSSATSNGVGKSSIADALCWSLYGETARGISGDDVINNIAKKNCCVSVTLKDGATVYRIERYRKDATFKNATVVTAFTLAEYAKGGVSGVDMSKGVEKETQAVIETIMGCSLDVFMAAIYAGQEVTPDLPNMTDKQLKLLIEEASGVERLEAAYKIAGTKLTSAKITLSAGETSANNMVVRLNEVRLSHAKRLIEAREFDDGREGRAATIKATGEAAKEGLLALGRQIKDGDEAGCLAKLANLELALADHKTSTARAKELRQGVSDAQRLMDAAATRLDGLKKVATRMKGMLDNAPEEMKKPCPECGKPHTADEEEEYVAHLKPRVISAITNAKTSRDAWLEAEADVTKWRTELSDFEASLPDFSKVLEEQRAWNNVLREIAAKKTRFVSAKKEYDRVGERAAAILVEPNPHTSALEVLQTQIGGLESSLLESKVKLDAYQEEVDVAESVAKVFSPAGVRAHILDTVTPFLNDRTADYLSALSDGNISATWTTLARKKDGDLREKFNIEVTNDKGAKSFRGLSGGEKRKVRLATMLALQDMVASRATKPINLWMGDEIDDALDSAGLERLMTILERKSRERGTVLVISHNSLRDWVDDVATVTKKGGVSTIEGALC